MSQARLEARVGKTRVIGVRELGDYRHRFNKLGNDGTAKGNIEPAVGSRVFGVVYELSRDQLAALALIESGYRAQSIALQSGAGDRLALEPTTFVATVLSEIVKPTIEYLSHYREGVRQHGLPADYVRDLFGDFA